MTAKQTKPKAKAKKPTVAFVDLTGCQGCVLSFLFNEDELLDIAGYLEIKDFRFVKESRKEPKTKKIDIIFVEGLVASEGDLAKLKQLRENAETLVALGACSGTGCIPAYRNFMDLNKFAHLFYEKIDELKDVRPTPIDTYVKVDHFIPGCPPDKKEIITFIKDTLLEKVHHPYDKPVCFECKLNETMCLIAKGKPCLGSVTRGGCGAVCTKAGFECWGCRGPLPDANTDVLLKLLEEKGHKKEEVKNRIRTFAGMKIEEPPEQNMKEIMLKIKKEAKKKAEKERLAKQREKQAEKKRQMMIKKKQAREEAMAKKKAAREKMMLKKKLAREKKQKEMAKKKAKLAATKKKSAKKSAKKTQVSKKKTAKKKSANKKTTAQKKKTVKKKKKTAKNKVAKKKKTVKKKSVASNKSKAKTKKIQRKGSKKSTKKGSVKSKPSSKKKSVKKNTVKNKSVKKKPSKKKKMTEKRVAKKKVTKKNVAKKNETKKNVAKKKVVKKKPTKKAIVSSKKTKNVVKPKTKTKAKPKNKTKKKSFFKKITGLAKR